MPNAGDIRVDDTWTDCGRCGARFPTRSTCANHNGRLMTDSLGDSDGCTLTVVHHGDNPHRVQITLQDRYEGTEAVLNVSRSALLSFAKELISRLETD